VIDFLSTHFPPEVLDAFHGLGPGSFKADLFRYCILLVHGGFYADLDYMLSGGNLDIIIAKDVGFMAGLDDPGRTFDRRHCIQNGFLAVAPGHPFLARVLQNAINNVRNRFTSVDIDRLFCPNPEMRVTYYADVLFTTGPCLLGASINMVLGRPGQMSLNAGEFEIGMEQKMSLGIPGRTIFLDQNLGDVSPLPPARDDILVPVDRG